MALGIYIQVPFCQTKCTYCNFRTGVVARDRYEPYVGAVCREIELSEPGSMLRLSPSAQHASHPESAAADKGSQRDRSLGLPTVPDLRNAVVDTVYFGGGTPSLLDPAALARILDALHHVFHFVRPSDERPPSATCHSACPEPSERESRTGTDRVEESAFASPEVTLEADPETITPDKAAAWLAAGFDRISLGAQSFNDAELRAAGRMHRRDDIFTAVHTLRAAGFDNISMDLIAGLPHQTRATWEESVSELFNLGPEHISIYMLEIDEGSRLGTESLAGGVRYGAQAIPPDDAVADFYESACARLAAAGYDHYEISNWACPRGQALPSRRSRHNLKYWRREPYVGFGAGAHSFDGTRRWANVHDAAQYVACIERGISPREQIEEVTPAQALEEELFLGLRQLDGIDLARLEREYNGSTAALSDRISALRSQGLVELSGTRIRLAPDRLAVSNEVFVELLR